MSAQSSEYPVKLVEVELSKEIPTFEDLHEYKFLSILVRLHDEPLGTIYMGIYNGRCPSTKIKREVLKSFSWPIIQHLVKDGLTEPLEEPKLVLSDLVGLSHPPIEASLPALTVAICTRDRPDDLKHCLEAVEKTIYPDVEIIVVDNAPKDDRTEQLVKEQFPAVRYIREHRPGLDWARNRAVAAARGEIIAYTDDDVLVDRNWFLAIGETFAENPEIMALTGLVLPYELDTEAQVIFEARGGFGRGFQQVWHQSDPYHHQSIYPYLGTGGLGTGANMAFRRTVFDHIGLFDTALDVGTLSCGAGDLDMFFRVLYAGYALLYEPQALVFHRHRRDMEGLKKQIEDSGTGLAAYHAKCMAAYKNLRYKFFRFHLWWLWEWHIKRLLRSYTRPVRFPRELIWIELKGYIFGYSRYRKAQRQAEVIASDYEQVIEEPGIATERRA